MSDSARNSKEIRDAIRSKYAEVSISAAGKFRYPVGKEGALALGYDPAVIEGAHSGLLESYCGVGNHSLWAQSGLVRQYRISAAGRF